jgi:N-acetylglutamate synthase-like GNAT family acetyltransferase
MQKEFHITTEDDHLRIIQFLEDRLYEFNGPLLNRHDGRLFAFTARNRNNTIVGGIAGWTWAGIGEITQLWVDASVRTTGIGKLLLETAIAEATNNNCQKIMVRTFSFQAPKFYRKYGFETVHTIDDFPAGYQYHILTKTISAC